MWVNGAPDNKFIVQIHLNVYSENCIYKQSITNYVPRI